MPIPGPRGITVVRLRGTRVSDGYGGTRIDWTDPDRKPIDGCAIAPLVEGEERDRGREGVVTALTLYAPHGSDIQADDRVETPADGVLHVEGPTRRWQSPFTGWKAGLTATLRRVDG